MGEHKALRVMDHHPELSLGSYYQSNFAESSNSSSSESETNPSRKRKYSWDEPRISTSIDLQLDDPLPSDWEQCLDLQSGRMYYLNRKTLNKCWSKPKVRKLDLDLNISTITSSSEGKFGSMTLDESETPSNSGTSMFAVPCLKCHLLVMLCRSSPSCPNCKYVHPLPAQRSPQRKIETVKSLETLSLLN